MASKFKSRHGIDYWPVEMTDLNIDLLYAKKWRILKERHGSLKDDPGDVYVSALKELYGDAFKVSPWTEAHVHHWVKKDKPIYWGSASCGKALLPTEKIYFEDRVGTMADVRPGDRIFTANGTLAAVKAVYDHVDHDLYEVSFSDGSNVICDADHLWSVELTGRVRWDGPRKTRKSITGRIKRIVPTKRLAAITEKSLASRHYTIPLSMPVDFPTKSVPIDPYVLGCLIGDGSLTDTVLLTSADNDSDVRREFSKGLPYGYSLKRVSNTITYQVVKTDGGKGENVVNTHLSSLGLRGKTSADKFIPDVYLLNSIDVRTSILAGLMDTDGSVTKDGRVSFSTTSLRLANDVRTLMESLGASVTVTKRNSSYVNSDGVRVNCRQSYELFPHGMDTESLKSMFRLERKRSLAKAPSRMSKTRTITSVKKVEDRSAYPRKTRCLTLSELDESLEPTNGLFVIGDRFVVTHNSNDVAACAVPHWMIEPYDTIILVGSTTKDALRIRVWEAIERYFATAKQYGKDHGFLVPGKITQTGYAILNDRQNDDNPNAQGGKAGIHGVALNEGGKLQGAHLPSVAIIIDELATINNHNDILTTISNLLVTEDFKFAAMANPEPWSNPSSSIYCTPVDGIASVSVETREWDSTFGASVLHDDGLKSPCVLDPKLGPEFPFLTQEKHIQKALQVAGGNENAPSFWKMARGFPTPVATGMPPVLDPMIAVNMRVQEPGPPMDYSDIYAIAAGIDPAWTEGGDGACRARCYVRRDSMGKMYLDFTGGLTKLAINSQDKAHPPVQQMRAQILEIMRRPFEASFENTAIDASANQGLGDDLLIYAGANCLNVNFSVRASEAPLRANDLRPIRETIYDRGTEAWCVLAEFCKAGMVRGLPSEAVRAITMRSYSVNRDKEGNVLNQKFPLRLEEKKLFKPKFKHSPDECDACALAALAVKERIGLLPFGFIERPIASSGFQEQSVKADVPIVRHIAESFDTDFDDGPDFDADAFG